MMNRFASFLRLSSLPLVGAALAAAILSSSALAAPGGHAGAVYAMTNAVEGNQIMVYGRSADGRLGAATAYPTGGSGSGTGLGSQGALVLSESGDWLLAVDAGSNEISAFAVDDGVLVQTDRQDSGGLRPVSVTVHDDLVYTLNADSDSLAGFRLGADGMLSPIAGSQRALSATGTAPAQAEFNNDGDLLVVTEKATGNVLVFPVDADGLLGAPSVNASPTPTPFGFAFGKRDQVFVSEAAGGAPGASTLSSYQLAADASATLVTASAPTLQAAACWVAVTRDGRYAYTTNTADNTLSGFAIDTDGTLRLLDADGIAANVPAGSAPTDMALARNSRFLYALSPGSGTISVFRIASDGSLSGLQAFSSGLPGSAVGLAAQ